jgi:hypothetical protein
MSLLIKSNGIIERTTNDITKDVTNHALYYLMEPCKFDKNVVLKDIISILKRDLEIYSIIINQGVEHIVPESSLDETSDDSTEDISYLNIKWLMESDEHGFGGYAFPNLDGVCQNGDEKKNLAIDFCSVASLVNLPIKLSNDAFLHINKTDVNLKNPEYTLLHILYAVVWELGWHGNTQQKKAKLDNLIKLSKEVKNQYKGENMQINDDALT